jgi:diphthamide synthase (EF-2-diphthine--ammonia ligase)
VTAEHPAARHIAFGDLFLEDVRAYRERLLGGTRFEPMFPVWGLDTAQLARRFVRDGFVAHLVCVDTTQLDGRFAGRLFDEALLDEFPASVDPCGERGEFHTFVSEGPVFRAPIACTPGELVLRDDRFAYCDLMPLLER